MQSWLIWYVKVTIFDYCDASLYYNVYYVKDGTH